VLLRFSEDMRPVEIATHLGIPQATVRSRLSRGCAMLRSELDETYGNDGRAWSVKLLPLAQLAARTSASISKGAADAARTSIGLASSTRSLTLIGVATAAALMLVIGPRWRPISNELPLTRRSMSELTAQVEGGSIAAMAPRDRALSNHAIPTEFVANVERTSAHSIITGRVQDSEGRPIAGVGVRLLHNRWAVPGTGSVAIARTHADGQFRHAAAEGMTGERSLEMWAIAQSG
jgi:hypothetical protein